MKSLLLRETYDEYEVNIYVDVQQTEDTRLGDNQWLCSSLQSLSGCCPGPEAGPGHSRGHPAPPGLRPAEGETRVRGLREAGPGVMRLRQRPVSCERPGERDP